MTKADLLEAWQSHLALSKRRSPHTIRAYLATAGRLIDSLGKCDWRDLAAMDGRALRYQLASRRAEGIGNTSAARELSALKSFIAFAREKAGMADMGGPRVRGPRVKKGLPRPVTPDDALALVETVEDFASQDWIGRRDRAVLFLLYGAGLRISEALSLKGAQVPLGETVTVTGKGGKQRVVPILPAVSQALDVYLDANPWPVGPEDPVFRGAKGGPLAQGMVQKSVAQARKVLGLPPTATPHALRHSFATHLLGAGADLRSLQELLGHASLGSTQIYTKVDAATMLDTYRKAHPRGE